MMTEKLSVEERVSRLRVRAARLRQQLGETEAEIERLGGNDGRTASGARFPRRRFTSTDRKILGVLLDENGPGEILIALGQYLAHELEGRRQGDVYRSQCHRIAHEIADAPIRP